MSKNKNQGHIQEWNPSTYWKNWKQRKLIWEPCQQRNGNRIIVHKNTGETDSLENRYDNKNRKEVEGLK
jgi:hypothetical protein